jgi:aerobic carbon-monoxide dehydrogenase medium subunit
MKLPAFDYRSPESIDAAIRILREEAGAAKVIAGGQSLIPLLAFRLAAPSVLVDLRDIPGLNGIEIGEDGISIGAMVRWCDIENHSALRVAHPLLTAALAHVAHYQIRNRGTIGGSLAHADPAAEMPGIAMTCDAELKVVGGTGRRLVPAHEFFVGPLMTSLDSDELIEAVRLPAWRPDRKWAFEEFAARRGDFALAGIALYYDEESGRVSDAHVGVIGAGDVPQRLSEVEAVLNGKHIDAAMIALAARTAAGTVEPADDIHASGEYRRALVETLLERALLRASQAGHP